MDLLEKFDVGDPFPVISDDIFVLDTSEGVAILEVAVGVLQKSFVASHLYSGEVVSVTRVFIGRLLVGREEVRQCFPGANALC
jgi:hypothetical protein